MYICTLRSYLQIDFSLDYKQIRNFSAQFMNFTDIRHSDLNLILFIKRKWLDKMRN